jgi:hypothetical protein
MLQTNRDDRAIFAANCEGDAYTQRVTNDPHEASSAMRVTKRIDPILLRAMRATRMIGAVTATNAASERARLVAKIARGEDPVPAWKYAPEANDELRRELEEIARSLDAFSDDDESRLAALYAARAREIALEAHVASLAGLRALGEIAKTRFATDARDEREADALADAWKGGDRDSIDDVTTLSDESEAGSLLTRMRQEVGRRRLPFQVVVDPNLSALAATGEQTIFIAKGRALTRADVERTVVHEIEAHAEPRARAPRARVGLFAIGTASGTDDQEGLALVLEERGGHATSRRCRELAIRHITARAMDRGASFVEAFRVLVRDHNAEPRVAVTIAERVFRGSDGTCAGLGRERVYLPAFVRVKRALSESPDIEKVARAGQIAVDCASFLRPFAPR